MKEWGICMQGNEKFIAKAILETLCMRENNHTFRYLELGVAEGRTMGAVCDLLNLVAPRWVAVGVDISNGWSFNLEKYRENVSDKYKNTTLSLAGSIKAMETIIENKVDAIFIDGDHSKEAVIKDFDVAHRILETGGIIIFHDTAEEEQGLDVFSGQPDGIRVREAVIQLGLLENKSPEYELLVDYKGNRDKGGRGIIIVRKVVL